MPMLKCINELGFIMHRNNDPMVAYYYYYYYALELILRLQCLCTCLFHGIILRFVVLDQRRIRGGGSLTPEHLFIIFCIRMDLDPNAGHDPALSTVLRSVWHLASALYRDLGTRFLPLWDSISYGISRCRLKSYQLECNVL